MIAVVQLDAVAGWLAAGGLALLAAAVAVVRWLASREAEGVITKHNEDRKAHAELEELEKVADRLKAIERLAVEHNVDPQAHPNLEMVRALGSKLGSVDVSIATLGIQMAGVNQQLVTIASGVQQLQDRRREDYQK